MNYSGFRLFLICPNASFAMVVVTVLWKKIIMFFRRVLQKEPKSVFKTEPAFSAFIKTLDECMMNENDRKQIKHLKEMVFSAILSITHDNFSEDMKLYKSVLSASDLRVPHDWYPAARLRKRRIIYHGGPTNSGIAVLFPFNI